MEGRLRRAGEAGDVVLEVEHRAQAGVHFGADIVGGCARAFKLDDGQRVARADILEQVVADAAGGSDRTKQPDFVAKLNDGTGSFQAALELVA